MYLLKQLTFIPIACCLLFEVAQKIKRNIPTLVALLWILFAVSPAQATNWGTQIINCSSLGGAPFITPLTGVQPGDTFDILVYPIDNTGGSNDQCTIQASTPTQNTYSEHSTPSTESVTDSGHTYNAKRVTVTMKLSPPFPSCNSCLLYTSRCV